MGDLQVAIGTGGLDPKKHGCCLDLRLATISLDKKQCQSDKKPNNLHYIFESEVPQSPAEPLQNLIVQKKIAATCRRWVLVVGLSLLTRSVKLGGGVNRCAPSKSMWPYSSKAKMRFQSFFMLMTTQPCFAASSYSAWVKVPTLVS